MNFVNFSSFALFNFSEHFSLDSIPNFMAEICMMPVQILMDSANSAANIFSVTNTDTFMSKVQSVLTTGFSHASVILLSLGYAICIMFFLFHFLDIITNDQFTLEQFLKQMAQLVIGIGLVAFSPKLFEYIMQFGDGITSLIADQFQVSNTANVNIDEALKQNLADYFANHNFITNVFIIYMFLSIVIFFLFAALIIYLATYLIALVRIIEINLRGIFLPIAISLFAEDGWRGAAGRNIKRFLGICSQGAACCLIGKIYSALIVVALQVSLNNHGGTNADSVVSLLGSFALDTGLLLIIGIAAVIGMHKSGQWISEAFGA